MVTCIEDPITTQRGVTIGFASEELFNEATIGELAEFAAYANKALAAKLADPATRHEFAHYKEREDSAQDWGTSFSEPAADSNLSDEDAKKAKHGKTPVKPPVVPENEHDTFPRVMKNIAVSRNAIAAVEAASAKLADTYMNASSQHLSMLGIPEGVKGFKDSTEYVRILWNIPGTEAKTILARAKFYTADPGMDGRVRHTMPELTEAVFDGGVTPANADRVVTMNTNLHKYAQATGAPAGKIPEFFTAIDEHMTASATGESPWVFTRSCASMTEQAAHVINEDGPAPSEVLGKKHKEEINTTNLGHGWKRYSITANPLSAEIFDTLFEPATSRHYGKTSKTALIQALENLKNASEEETSSYEATDGEPKDQNEPALDQHNEAEETLLDTPEEAPANNDAVMGGDLETPSEEDEERSEEDADILAGDEVTEAPGEESEPVPTGEPVTVDTASSEHTDVEVLEEALGVESAHQAPAIDPIEDEDVEDAEAAYQQAVVAETIDGQPVTGREIQAGFDKRSRDQRRFDGFMNTALKYLSLAATHSILPKIRRNPIQVNIRVDEATFLRAIHRRNHHTNQFMKPGDRPPGENSAITDIPHHVQHQLGITPHEEMGRFMCEGEHTGPLPPRVLDTATCCADMLATVVGEHGHILHQGREKRLFTHYQATALRTRSGGCAIPGCCVPAIDCHVHHLDEWNGGGNTDINRAELLCWRHHLEIHDGTWRIIETTTGRWYQPAPWINPDQPLLRNTHWQHQHHQPPQEVG